MVLQQLYTVKSNFKYLQDHPALIHIYVRIDSWVMNNTEDLASLQERKCLNI